MNITTPCRWDSSESSGIRALAVTCAAACPDKRIGAGDILSECRHMRLQRFFPPSLCVDDLLLSSPHRSDSFAAKRLFPKLTLRHRRSLQRSRPTRKVPFLFYIQSSWDHVSDPPNRTTFFSIFHHQHPAMKHWVLLGDSNPLLLEQSTL